MCFTSAIIIIITASSEDDDVTKLLHKRHVGDDDVVATSADATIAIGHGACAGPLQHYYWSLLLNL